jgi:hypothetical protein
MLHKFGVTFAGDTDNYGRTVVCAKLGVKTWLTSVIGSTRSAELQKKGSAVNLTSWQNLYFKEQNANVDLSGITPQI